MWTDGNGNFYFGDCRPGDRAATSAEISAYNAQRAPAQEYQSAIAAGLAITWQTSTLLNGTYALGTDPITGQPAQVLINFELVSIAQNGTFTNGQSTRNWPDANGDFHSFTTTQFKAFATALALYVDQLAAALATAQSGGTPTWPTASVNIDQ